MEPALIIGIAVLALVAWIARPRSPGLSRRDSGGTDLRRVIPDLKAIAWARAHKYRKLSLIARAAMGLVCFERYCQAKGLRHPAIDQFIEHMWDVPCMKLDVWEARDSILVDFVHGGDKRDPLPPDLLSVLNSAGINETEFEELVHHCVEIFYCSIYTMADHVESLQSLDHVIRVTAQADVTPPPIEPFLISLASQSRGWGNRPTPEQRDRWRSLASDGASIAKS